MTRRTIITIITAGITDTIMVVGMVDGCSITASCASCSWR
jgi:hypothetical protein